MRLDSWKNLFAIFLFCALTAIATQAQTFADLVLFDGNTGIGPNALLQSTDGNFYGVTFLGGTANDPQSLSSGQGTIFKMTPEGVITTLYNFCSQPHCSDGSEIQGALVQTANGNLYGTTSSGGNSSNNGTVFEFSLAGKLTTLYSFCSQTSCTDGASPLAGLVEGADGNLYGTTLFGGINGWGTVFKITPAGKLTTLYSFCSVKTSHGDCSDGAEPDTNLILARNGSFFGATDRGGSHNAGTIFEITPTGWFTTVVSFQRNGLSGGVSPNAVMQAVDGNLYGTTNSGGGPGRGTVFKLTQARRLETLYTFCTQANCPDGTDPVASLVQGSDGNLYGTTIGGGTGGQGGTIFQMTPEGTLTTLYTFCKQGEPCSDGQGPDTALVQGTNGIFYGGTDQGGRRCQCGVIFSENMGLSAFVETRPGFGAVGRVIQILGNNLTGSTRVEFNGTSATFKVISSTYIKAEVPSGATSGAIAVTTPDGTLQSDVPFQVVP